MVSKNEEKSELMRIITSLELRLNVRDLVNYLGSTISVRK